MGRDISVYPIRAKIHTCIHSQLERIVIFSAFWRWGYFDKQPLHDMLVARQQFWIFRVSAMTDPLQGHRCVTCPTKCPLPGFLLRCPSLFSPTRHTNPELLLDVRRVDSGTKWRSEVQILPVILMEALLSFWYEWVANDGSFLHPSSNSVSSHLTRLALDQIIITVVWMIIRFTQRRGWLQHLQTPVQRKSTFWFGGCHYEATYSLFSPKASWNHTEILKYVHFFLPYTLCYTWYKRELNCVCTLRNYKWFFFLILQTIFDSWFYDGV